MNQNKEKIFVLKSTSKCVPFIHRPPGLNINDFIDYILYYDINQR